jgi:CDP-diacylglycerol--glycerol-3-phosphate 3-phosphatidyltransferase
LKEKFWNIPNCLSLYRLIIFPVLLYWIFSGEAKLVAIFIAISLITDFLDGIIARTFNLQTQIGAKLDSWADTGTFICAFLAIYFFKWDILRPYVLPLFIFFGAWLLSYVVVLVKFRGLIGLHTYLFKITGYLQGAFILLLFAWKFIPLLFYVAMCVGTIACIEEIIIAILLAKPASNVKGLYWVIRKREKA